MTAPVSVERSDAAAIVTIDSPAARNTLSAPVAEALVDALADLDDAACVLLRGEGETFCAGGDVAAHVDLVEGAIDAETWDDRIGTVGRAVQAVYDCPVPTVAAVDGAAFSEGACLALACDLRVASEDGRIGVGFRRFGQAAAAGATWLLPRVVGEATALELLYTGELLGAERAAALGLFDRVHPPAAFDDAVASLVATLSTGPGAAMRAAKRLVRADHGSLAGAIAAEAETQQRLRGEPAFEEGVSAFLQQRDPQF